jgi:hypothetical protein
MNKKYIMKKVIRLTEADLIRIVERVIKENIDDILDKMNQGQELSQDDKDKMNAYSQHLQSGGKESNFEYTPKQTQSNANYVYKIDEHGRIDLNTPIEQVHKIFDNMFRGMGIAEGIEKWKPWVGSLSRVIGKGDQPDEQIIKWKIVFTVVDERYNYLGARLGVLDNIDTGEKEIWFISPNNIVSISREEYPTQVEDPEDDDLKYGLIFLTQPWNNNPKLGATKEAINFGQRAFKSWVEKKLNLPRGEYALEVLNKSDRLRLILNDIKDNIVGKL